MPLSLCHLYYSRRVSIIIVHTYTHTWTPLSGSTTPSMSSSPCSQSRKRYKREKITQAGVGFCAHTGMAVEIMLVRLQFRPLLMWLFRIANVVWVITAHTGWLAAGWLAGCCCSSECVSSSTPRQRAQLNDNSRQRAATGQPMRGPVAIHARR